MSRTLLFQTTRNALLPLVDESESLDKLDTDSHGYHRPEFHIDGVSVYLTVASSGHYDRAAPYLIFHIGNRVRLTLQAQNSYYVDASWNVRYVVNTEIMFPLTSEPEVNVNAQWGNGWDHYHPTLGACQPTPATLTEAEEVANSLLIALKKALPANPTELDQNAYHQGHTVHVHDEVFTRSDFASDAEMNRAVKAAQATIVKRLLDSDKLFDFDAKPSELDELETLEIEGYERTKRSVARLPFSMIPTVRREVQERLAELKGDFDNPPPNDLVSDKDARKIYKRRATKLASALQGMLWSFQRVASVQGTRKWDPIPSETINGWGEP